MCVICGKAGPDYPMLPTDRYGTLERLIGRVRYTTQPGKTSFRPEESYEFAQSVKQQIQEAIQSADRYLKSANETDKYKELVAKEQKESEALLERFQPFLERLSLACKEG